MFSVLAVDSGNSFLKWGYFENNQWIIQDKIRNEDVEKLSDTWEFLKQPDIIIVSHVTSDVIYDKLSRLLNIWNTKPYWVTPLPRQCGVTNSYEKPHQLGSDRWAAIIAAWNRCHESCLVVNIGTTLTIDALSEDGVFLGGIIVAGSYIMLNSIQLNTQLDLNNEKNFQYEIFPIRTADAIYSGVIQSLLGSIERMIQLFKRRQGYAVKNCIISGGGVADILPHIDFTHTVIDNLVLEGLLIIAKEMQLNKKM